MIRHHPCGSGRFINMNRRYIQINDLVIDQFDMLADANNTRPNKVSTQQLMLKHGIHFNVKRQEVLADAQSLSISLHLDIRKLEGAQDYDLYKQFVLQNLSRHGHIFAIEGRALIWTYFLIEQDAEIYSTHPDYVTIDVDLTLPWGFWIEADHRTIFFAPFDICDWNWAFNLRRLEECKECTCVCKATVEECPWCIEQCEFLTIENSLCVRGWDALRTFIEDCDTRYRLLHNCEARNRLWHRPEDLYEFSYCANPEETSIIATTFQGHTTLTTSIVTLILDGHFVDPIIEFNSIRIQIMGEFNGRLVIRSNLTWLYCGEDCVEKEGVIFPISGGLELYVVNGSNRIVVDSGECCAVNCVRVNYRPITK